MEVVRKDNRFCVEGQDFSIELPDTSANRKVVVVFLRGMRDGQGKPLFTLQELAGIVESSNRQAASQHVEEFRACGEDFKGLLTRKRKVDEQVVEAVGLELGRDPLIETQALQARVGERLGREDLSVSNIEAALDQISCRELRRVVRKQLSGGEAHYQEAYLLEEMMGSLSCQAGQRAGLGGQEGEGMDLSDPTAIRKLIDPDVSMGEVSESLRWVGVCLTLYYWGVPLSRLGRWLGVHKTTVLRWMLGVVLALWPTVSGWIVEKIRLGVVYIDEKWIKIRGGWHYWFVALDGETEIPVCQILAPRRSKWVCRWIGICLSRLKGKIKAICTDGFSGYDQMACDLGGVHLRCHFHHQQGVTSWLKAHFSKKEEVEERKGEMKQVLQTKDKRTVQRRLDKLSEKAEAWGIGGWVDGIRARLSNLLPAIGSRVFPTTINAIERFFRTFNRFYKVRGGFHSPASAKRELLLFLLVYLFTIREKEGRAPIELIVPQASQMPLYRLINDPFLVLRGVPDVKLVSEMADETPADLLAA